MIEIREKYLLKQKVRKLVRYCFKAVGLWNIRISLFYYEDYKLLLFSIHFFFVMYELFLKIIWLLKLLNIHNRLALFIRVEFKFHSPLFKHILKGFIKHLWLWSSSIWNLLSSFVLFVDLLKLFNICLRRFQYAIKPNSSFSSVFCNTLNNYSFVMKTTLWVSSLKCLI